MLVLCLCYVQPIPATSNFWRQVRDSSQSPRASSRGHVRIAAQSLGAATNHWQLLSTSRPRGPRQGYRASRSQSPGHSSRSHVRIAPRS